VIENEFGSLAVAGHHPAWKAAVPRDNGSSWDFEDVRDHYVHALFGEDAREVRWSDPERYLDLGRAAVCEAFASTLGYWRRPDSRCDGALTLALRDLEPGPGWGVLDWNGDPKAPWFVLRRSAKPIALLVTDDGMDGLRLDAINETAEPVVGEIRFRAHSRSGVVPVDVALPVKVEAHSSLTWSVDSLVGRFTDLTHVFRFGARTYDAVTVTLEGEDGEMVDEVVHLLGSSARPLERSVGLVATARTVGDDEWVVDVTTDAAAQYVALELQGFEPEDSWFHLAPNGRRTVHLRRTGQATKVIGRVRALNSHTSVAVTPPSVPATRSSPTKRTTKKTSVAGN
jgi:beta-mannosidase